MKFSSLLAFGLSTSVLASPAIVERDVSTYKKVISNISNKVDALGSAINSYNGGNTAPVQDASDAVVSAINMGVTTVKGAKPLDTSGALALVTPVQDLTKKVNKVVGNLDGKKNLVEQAGACQQVLKDLKQQKAAAMELATAISAKVPPSLKSTAKSLSAGISQAIQKGIDTYKNCQNSATTTAPTTTAPTTTAPTTTAPTTTAPTNTVPTNTVPTNTVPTNTAPTNTVPTNTVPTNTISSTVTATTCPTRAPKPKTTVVTVTQTVEDCGNTQTTVAPPSTTATSSPACPTDLSGNYEYPHLIVPIDSSMPDAAEGTSYFGTVSDTISSIFNFDIPPSDAGKTCSLIFLFPKQSDLETSSYTFSGDGKIDVSKLKSPATAQTTYNNAPDVAQDLGTITIAPGNSYQVATFDCPAGQRVGYEISSAGSTDLHYFQDYNPAPIGLYITTC